MAEFGRVETLTLQAAADLRNNQYNVVRISGVQLCNVASDAAKSSVIGVLANKPNTNQFAEIAVFGKYKVVAGAAITAGDNISYNGSGRAITVVSGNNMVIGKALETSTADGQLISVWLTTPMQWAGAA